MNDTVSIVIVLTALAAALLVAAAPVSTTLVRLRASRLPTALALRMEEEWLGELDSISSGPGKLIFAFALTLTRRRAFVASGENMVKAIPGFGGRKSLAILSTVLFALAAYGASFFLPAMYESEALLQIRDREDLVSLLRQAGSKTLLASVVDEMPKSGADSRERTIDDLRKGITVTALRESPSSGTLFRVKYRAPDPASAQNFTAKLTTRLIQQDLSQHIDQLHEEEKFLHEQLETLSARMRDKDEELAQLLAAKGERSVGMLALDRDLLVSSYKDLFAKHQDVQMAASLRQGRVSVVDPPQLGTEIVPNRAAFAGVGAFVGFAAGGVAVFGLGRRQRRLLASRS
jgi:hypothetical protein